MSGRFTDEGLDARLTAFLGGRAEDGAARARTPEQVAAEIERRIRPGSGIGLRMGGSMRLAWLVVIAMLLLGLLALVVSGGRLPSLVPTRIAGIAIELSLGGSDQGAVAIADGVKLAVNDVNGQAGRFQIEIPDASILSDSTSGVPDAARGAANMRRIVADPDVVAVIGPSLSFIAQDEIPISHTAGLLQCGPATTDPGLTGISGPGRVSFIRTVTTDDIAAAGAARYLYGQLGKRTAYVMDDNQAFGMAMADWFTAEFTRLGGTVTTRASLSGTAAELATMLTAARAKQPQAIYFGDSGEAGATVLKAIQGAGLGEIPFIGTDALHDGSAITPGSFLNLAGPIASRVISVVPALPGGPEQAAFAARYRTRYGVGPTPFAAAGYACGEVVIAALRRIDASPDAATVGLRDAVRGAGVDTQTTFQTVLGPIAFDARGDVTPGLVTIYTFDARVGDWVATN
jgi:branched-chain amino acid transport system substrate-binding protein